MASLNLFGKIHVVNIWLIISVNDFIRAGLSNFNNGEETPSKPHKLNMFLFMGLCICVARFGPILVKQLLNLLDMSVFFITFMESFICVCSRKNVIDRVPRFLILVLEGREAHFPFLFLSFHGQMQQSQALSD